MDFRYAVWTESTGDDSDVREGRGTHFDPRVLDAFFAREAEVLEVRNRYQGPVEGDPEATSGVER